jgi:hypothetical protein
VWFRLARHWRWSIMSSGTVFEKPFLASSLRNGDGAPKMHSRTLISCQSRETTIEEKGQSRYLRRNRALDHQRRNENRFSGGKP